MRFLILTGLALTILAVKHQRTDAGPLRMDYIANELGSEGYGYYFRLTLDNNDGSWSSGDGWSWIIFGDSPTLSPLSDFDPTGAAPAGFFFSLSGGGHNGPTLHVLGRSSWTPTFVGEFISWSGTSTTNLLQGELLFSTIRTTNGATPEVFTVANRVTQFAEGSAVPEPASLALMGLGGIGMIGGWYRKRRKMAA